MLVLSHYALLFRDIHLLQRKLYSYFLMSKSNVIILIENWNVFIFSASLRYQRMIPEGSPIPDHHSVVLCFPPVFRQRAPQEQRSPGQEHCPHKVTTARLRQRSCYATARLTLWPGRASSRLESCILHADKPVKFRWILVKLWYMVAAACSKDNTIPVSVKNAHLYSGGITCLTLLV